jgi:hypothetical protein
MLCDPSCLRMCRCRASFVHSQPFLIFHHTRHISQRSLDH